MSQMIVGRAVRKVVGGVVGGVGCPMEVVPGMVVAPRK